MYFHQHLVRSFVARIWVACLVALAVLSAGTGCSSEPDHTTKRPTQPGESPGTGGPAEAGFSEVAHETGLTFEHWNGMSGKLYFPEVFGSGAALFDYDRDGDLDVYLVQGSSLDGQPATDATFPREEESLGSRLFRNELVPTGQLRFLDVSRESGAMVFAYGMGVAAGDYDNDAWPDLYVTALGENHLLRNQGDGTFRDETARAGVSETRWSVPAVFFDYDRDGWLDLYVGNYVEWNLGAHRTCRTEGGEPDYCGPTNFRPATDRLWRNLGNGTFEDVTHRAGLGGAAGNTLGAIATDIDDDGWQDLYVANDWMANRLWANRGDGRFEDVAVASGTALSGEGLAEASMGVGADDFDADGDIDLVVSHLRRETNTLYRNRGDWFLTDASIETGLGPPSWNSTGFGLSFFDYDNDGVLDLFVANGEIKKLEEQGQTNRAFPLAQPDQLWHGDGERFTLASQVLGERPARVGRGTARGDIDNDGRLDLLVVNNSGPVELLHNRVEGGAWLGLTLRDRSGRDAVGARVTLTLGKGRLLLREIQTGGSYASANDPRAHFGLGEHTVERVEVRWPTGQRETFPAPAPGTYTELRQGSSETPRAPVAPEAPKTPGVPETTPSAPGSNGTARR